MNRPDRRRLLRSLGVLAALPLAARARTVIAKDQRATPVLAMGPQYPKTLPGDTDWDMTRVAGRDDRAAGVPIEVTGRVVNRQENPQPGLRIEFWQADNDGVYPNVGGKADANFQGFAAVTTDAEGRYKLRTIKPVPYTGRTAHIHFLVKDGDETILVSEIFIEGEAGNAGDSIYRSLGANADLVTLKLVNAPKDSGVKFRGTFDIVLKRDAKR